MTKDKKKAGFSLDAETIELLNTVACSTRLSKSAIIDIAVKLFADKVLNVDKVLGYDNDR